MIYRAVLFYFFLKNVWELMFDTVGEGGRVKSNKVIKILVLKNFSVVDNRDIQLAYSGKLSSFQFLSKQTS